MRLHCFSLYIKNESSESVAISEGIPYSFLIAQFYCLQVILLVIKLLPIFAARLTIVRLAKGCRVVVFSLRTKTGRVTKYQSSTIEIINYKHLYLLLSAREIHQLQSFE